MAVVKNERHRLAYILTEITFLSLRVNRKVNYFLIRESVFFFKMSAEFLEKNIIFDLIN